MILFNKRILKLFILMGLGLISSLAMQFFPMAIAQPPAVQTPITNNSQIPPEDWLQQGREAYQNGQYAKAVEYWLNAANFYQKDKLNLALVWNYLSLAYQQLNHFDEAKNAISTSLNLLAANQNTNATAQRQQILARSLTTSARLELANGQAENALDSLKKAEAIYKEIGDMQGVIGSQINQAQALQALGRYRRALQTLNQVEETLKKAETFNTQLDPLIKATKLYSLGNTLQVVGDLEHSWCVFQDSLVVAERLENSQLVGDIYLSLGNTARAFGKRLEDLQGLNSKQKLPLTIPENCQKPPQEDTALGFYQQAGEWYKKVAETESFSDSTRLKAQLNYLNILVSVLSTEAWKDKWQNYLAEADKLWPNIYKTINILPASRQEVYARINLVRNLGLLKVKSGFNQSWSEIENLLQKAIAHARNLEDPKAKTYSLGTYGWLYEQQKNYGEAQKFTEQALSLANEIKAPDIKYQWEWQLGRIYAARENLKDAIAAYEKALETINVVRKGLVGIPLDLTGINSDIQFYFRDNVEPIYREAVDLVLRSENPDLEKARQLVDDLQVAELENYLQCIFPNPEVQQVKVDTVDPQAAVIYTIILNNSLEVILKLPGKDNIYHYSTKIPKIQLETTLAELRGLLASSTRSAKLRFLSQQVYDWVIREGEEKYLANSSVNTLVFVLDGALRDIPMSILDDGKRYLVEKYAITLSPSLKLLEPKPLERKKLNVLLAGVSEERVIDKRTFKAVANVPDELNAITFKALTNVPDELNAIQSIVSSRGKLLNDDFIQNNLKKEIESIPFTVIHIATHGNFSSNPDNTYILLWNELFKVKDFDRLLRTANQNQFNNIELLVLSACETATGDKRATLGLAGVAVRAGAGSTLATLWSVNDTSTTVFMSEFYRQLTTDRKATKAEVLRRTQIKLLNSDVYNLPYYWAPFVLLGNWL